MAKSDGESKQKAMHRLFSCFAEKAASLTGTPYAFALAIGFVIAWAIAGPILAYSPVWKMIMGEAPAIITFLLVFLIQCSQNRETRALQLKLNELIRATAGAHTMMLNLEKLTEAELKIISGDYELLAEEARKQTSRGQTDKGVPEILLTHNNPKVENIVN